MIVNFFQHTEVETWQYFLFIIHSQLALSSQAD